MYIVELCSKGPSQKGNPCRMEIISSPNQFFVRDGTYFVADYNSTRVGVVGFVVVVVVVVV